MLDLGGITHVGLDDGDISRIAGLGAFSGQLLHTGNPAGGGDDMGALLGKQPCGGVADTGAGARGDGGQTIIADVIANSPCRP